MTGNVWVVAEQWRGHLSEITYETLALGREVADGLGVPLTAVLAGCGIKELAQTLGARTRSSTWTTRCSRNRFPSFAPRRWRN